jgi:hypothetical protein
MQVKGRREWAANHWTQHLHSVAVPVDKWIKRVLWAASTLGAGAFSANGLLSRHWYMI